MIPVFANAVDSGDILYVDKNKLYFVYGCGDKQELDIDTHRLLALLETRSDEEWETKTFRIEPMRRDKEDGALLVAVAGIDGGIDWDMAVVFRCDLIEALKSVEAAKSVETSPT